MLKRIRYFLFLFFNSFCFADSTFYEYVVFKASFPLTVIPYGMVSTMTITQKGYISASQPSMISRVMTLPNTNYLYVVVAPSSTISSNFLSACVTKGIMIPIRKHRIYSKDGVDAIESSEINIKPDDLFLDWSVKKSS